jgi:hypothetical protein
MISAYWQVSSDLLCHMTELDTGRVAVSTPGIIQQDCGLNLVSVTRILSIQVAMSVSHACMSYGSPVMKTFRIWGLFVFGILIWYGSVLYGLHFAY